MREHAITITFYMEHFLIKDFARRTSPELLTAYVKKHGYSFSTKHKKPSEIAEDFEKFLIQNQNLYKTADQELMIVYELANGNGGKLLTDEAKQRNHDLTGIENYTSQERALWFYLNHKDIFDFAQTQHELVSKNGWVWYQTTKKLELIGGEKSISEAIANHLSTHQYRGKKCVTDRADRDGDICFVTYSKDYKQREPIFDEVDKFDKNAVFNPAFRIYFTYRPHDGLIGIKTGGGTEFADEIMGVFAHCAFGVEVTEVERLKYVPHLLLDPEFNFQADIKHRVKQIKVVGAAFKNTSNPQERTTITCGRKDGAGNATLLKTMERRNIDLDNFEVQSVTLRFLFLDRPYKGSKGTVTTTITPDKMPLERKDLHKKAFDILLELGIRQ